MSFLKIMQILAVIAYLYFLAVSLYYKFWIGVTFALILLLLVVRSEYRRRKKPVIHH